MKRKVDESHVVPRYHFISMGIASFVSSLLSRWRSVDDYLFEFNDLLRDGNVGTVVDLDDNNCIQWFVTIRGLRIPVQELTIDLTTWPRAPDEITTQIDATSLAKKVEVEVVDVGCEGQTNCGPGWTERDQVFFRKFSNETFVLDFIVRPVGPSKIRPLDPKIRVKPSN
ncbi:MAG: hypothetical protein AAFN74_23550 [Myxococcota bacterium]